MKEWQYMAYAAGFEMLGNTCIHYRERISAWLFIITFLSTLVLSIATVGFHAFRVARTNPVQSLRYE